VVGDRPIRPPDLVVWPPLHDPQVDPFLRRDRNPSALAGTNAKGFNSATCEGLKERRPSLSPSVERQKFHPQPMLCVEIRRRGGIWAQHPRHAQPDRSVRGVELLTRVGRRNASPLLQIAPDQGFDDGIYPVFWIAFFGVDILIN
jgi:hypothetical protein